jgi:hypothetical protein
MYCSRARRVSHPTAAGAGGLRQTDRSLHCCSLGTWCASLLPRNLGPSTREIHFTRSSKGSSLAYSRLPRFRKHFLDIPGFPASCTFFTRSDAALSRHSTQPGWHPRSRSPLARGDFSPRRFSPRHLSRNRPHLRTRKTCPPDWSKSVREASCPTKCPGLLSLSKCKQSPVPSQLSSPCLT